MSAKQKLPPSSIHKRIIYSVLVAFIALLSYFIFNDYYKSTNRSRKEILKRLSAISFGASQLIDANEHAWLVQQYTRKNAIKKSDQDSIYYKLHTILSNFQKRCKLETPIYTIMFNSEDSVFQFILTSAEEPYYFHTYQIYPKALLEQYETGGVLDVYEDENGTWLSAFAPIKNSEGKTIALVQSDIDFSKFINLSRTEMIWNTLISIGLLIPVGFILLKYVSKLLHQQIGSQVRLQEQHEEIRMQNEEIKSQNELIENQNKELDNRVNQRTSQLQQLNKELSNFLYHYSHDIQAPIATLKGLLGLGEKEITDTKAQEYFKRLILTTERLESISKTIKLVHEIKTTELSIAPIPLKQLILDIIASMPQDNTIDFIIEIPDRYKLVNDRRLIKTILTEIIQNSFQYRTASTMEKPFVKIHLEEDQTTFAILEIDDNGEGIDPLMRQDIFMMFKRGSEKSKGLGLGLSVVKSCLDMSEGNIELKEKSTSGTTFVLSLKKYSL